MSDRVVCFRPLFRTLCLALVTACGGDNPLSTPSPASGMSTILVTLLTTGTAPDFNGYRVVVDKDQSHPVASSESASLSLTVPPGSHTIELTDVADNCVVSGGNPRLVSTSANGSTGVTFRVHCPRLGILRVRTSTTGVSLDPDGYLLTVNGAPRGTIGLQDSTLVEDLQPGLFYVRLSSVVGNCSVVGGGNRAVLMEDGELETLDLAVTCVPRIDEGPGEILVLTSRSFADQDFNLYLMRNGVRQRLTDHIGDELAPEITQAGDRILFLQSTEAGRSLKLLDRVTRQETLLPSQGVDRAIWSPDGSRIVLSRGGRLYRVAADGSGEFPLTTGGDDRDPYWSPDGTRIAFTRANTVYLVNADGTGLRQLSIDKRLAGPWSPDGRSLAVTVLDEVCSYYSYYCYYYGPTLTPSDLRILDLETLKETPLTNTPGAAEWSPAWSLDGQRVYFISSQNGATDLYAMALSGTSAVNLTQSPDLENWVSVAVVQGSPSHVRAR
jgi:hypothetical protein